MKNMKKTGCLNSFSAFIALGAIILFVSCNKQNDISVDSKKNTTKSVEEEQQKPVEELYEIANKYMLGKSFKHGAKAFAKVQEEYPYSKWSLKALLMEAYCRYQAHQYQDAIDGFSIFVQLHPYHDETAYAQYMIGLCDYERISITARDQKEAYQALEAFNLLLKNFPASKYAKDAKFKIDFINNHLSAQEMQIGRFYQKEKSYLAAINRFKNVIKNYQTTTQRAEALLRLVECYTALNYKDELFEVIEVLKKNHSGSVWDQHAKELLKIFEKNQIDAKKMQETKKIVEKEMKRREEERRNEYKKHGEKEVAKKEEGETAEQTARCSKEQSDLKTNMEVHKEKTEKELIEEEKKDVSKKK